MEDYGVEKILLAKSSHVKFIALIYPRKGPGTAKLFVGVAGNDVKTNIKGGATCNNSKQLVKASSLVMKLIQILPQNSHKRHGPSIALSKTVHHCAELFTKGKLRQDYAICIICNTMAGSAIWD